MKIRRFNESEQIELTNERVEEISSNLNDMIASIDYKRKEIETIINELEKFKNTSNKSNDQIDETLFSLQIVNKDYDNILDKLDTALNNIDSYGKEGRKYLYTDNK